MNQLFRKTYSYISTLKKSAKQLFQSPERHMVRTGGAKVWPLSMTTMVGNFRQKNNSAEDGIDGTNGYFRRNSVPNPSAEEKTTQNSVPLNKKRSKLTEFPSEHFSGRENNSEFLSLDTKIEEYSQNFLPNPSAEEKTTRNSFPWIQK